MTDFFSTLYNLTFGFDQMGIRYLLFICAFLGSIIAGTSPFLAFIAECQRACTGKVFHEKLAEQAVQVVLLAAIFNCMADFSLHIFSFSPLSTEQQASFASPACLLPSGLLLCVFSALCLYVWKKFRTNTLVRLFFLAPLLVYGTSLLLAITSNSSFLPLKNIGHTYYFLHNFYIFFTIISYNFVPFLFFWIFCSGLACSALLNALWLFFCRSKADYGRDYYSFALRFYTSSTLIALLCAPMFFAILLSFYLQLQLVFFIYIAIIWLILTLPICILLITTTISPTPMRHKISIIVSFILTVTTQLFLFSVYFLYPYLFQ